MTLLRTSNVLAVSVSLALAACRMDNPAFGDDELGSSESVGETLGTTDAGESGSATSEATTDATTTATTDATTDATDTSTTDAEGTSTDTTGVALDMMNENVCDALFGPPYSVIYGIPEVFDANTCPLSVLDHYVKVTGPGPSAGLITVQRCALGCESGCDGESYPIGVPGLSSFSDPIVTAAEQALVCLRVQTGPSYGLDQTRCGYASMWIGATVPSVLDLLVVQHQVGQLPAGGMNALGGHPPPSLGADKTVCSCESVFEGLDADTACCLDSMIEPYSTTQVFAGAEVKPNDEIGVFVGQGEWTFSVAQAQKYPACGVDPVGSSWALVRNL